MNFIKTSLPKAQAANKHIVFSEGQDPRIAQAAHQLLKNNVCQVTILATPEEFSESCRTAGVSFENLPVSVIDFTADPLGEILGAALYERRKAKGLSEDEARAIVKSQRLYFGNMMLSTDLVDGLVAGSIASTPDMLRASFHCIGTAKGIKLGSSCFVMDLREPSPAGNETLIYADCGVTPCPTAEQLVDIAEAAATSCRTLLNTKPKIAFLSFSSKGSAEHELVTKMQRATELTRERFSERGIEADVDGELQADAALVPSVGESKAKGSPVAGHANVLIFPDLQAGNICYKITERLAGATAYGPILQGLAKPVNDLSRGCSVDDIIGVTVITICQAL